MSEVPLYLNAVRIADAGRYHTVDYDPFTKSLLALT